MVVGVRARLIYFTDGEQKVSYILQWKNPAVDPGKVTITVPVGSVVSTAASLTFTGKGSSNYGKIQQENLMRLLENFADAAAPSYPTVGQLWFDTSISTLKVFSDSAPATWKSLGGVQVRAAVEGPPLNPQVGDIWFERTGDLSGYLYVYTGLGRFPYSTTTNGGWSQIWPRVDAAALRSEYEQVAGLANALATDISYLNGLAFTQLPNFSLLDADLETKRAATPDNEVRRGSTALVAQPVSYDWDALLSACRWLVSRLDLPLDSWEDVSSFPFVQDGRQARSYLFSQHSSFDPRTVPGERLANRQYGSVTLHRLYAETVNIMSAAAPFRYTLRGMAGASGTNSSFAPDVVTYQHCRRAGNWDGSSVVTANTLFNWNNTTERDRFIASGSAIEVTVRLVGGSGPSNDALNSFLNQRGRFRVTADMIRWFDSSATPVMAVAPTMGGLLDVTGGSGVVSIGDQTDSPYGLSVSGEATTNGLNLTVSVTSATGLTGQLQVTYSVICDRTTYDATELKLYPAPLSYNSATDSTGTTPVLANVILPSQPVANFTANGNTGPTQFSVAAGTAVSFAFTGFGSPTLVEWDFDGNGTFTATGTTASFTFTTPGVYSPRVRASNSSGADVLFRPGMINVT